MSTREEHDWEITDEYGEYVKTIKVVYYIDKAVCPECKGLGVLPFDNRVTIDFSDVSGRICSDEPEPSEEECFICHGNRYIEKIDHHSMTSKQTKTYEKWHKYCNDMEDKYQDNIYEQKAMIRKGYDRKEE